jgi:hypothetical protein
MSKNQGRHSPWCGIYTLPVVLHVLELLKTSAQYYTNDKRSKVLVDPKARDTLERLLHGRQVSFACLLVNAETCEDGKSIENELPTVDLQVIFRMLV